MNTANSLPASSNDLILRAAIVLVVAPCLMVGLALLIQSRFSLDVAVATVNSAAADRAPAAVAIGALTIYAKAVALAALGYLFTYPPSQLRLRDRAVTAIKNLAR